ncbi:MAG: hypothetical protein H7222_01025 [Methylotenera sp.]|nr:hypothetical protein [Oligoflexia bacterium]
MHNPGRTLDSAHSLLRRSPTLQLPNRPPLSPHVRDQMRGLLMGPATPARTGLGSLATPVPAAAQAPQAAPSPSVSVPPQAHPAAPAPAAPVPSSTGVAAPTYAYSHYSAHYSGMLPTHSFPPAIYTLISEIMRELEGNLRALLALNPSRREGVAQYLDRLAGITPGPSGAAGVSDVAGGLRRWVEGPRSPAQNSALQSYFEEIALVSLGQALVLKGWSERKIRNFREEDLGRLNWELSSSLKPHLPMDRESWQITKPNLYSWYNPSARIQKEIWSTLSTFSVLEQPPSFLANILRGARQYSPKWPEFEGYDNRFFKTLWDNLPGLGLDLGNGSVNQGVGLCTFPQRKRVFFSPTLRDGTIVHSCPADAQWVGLEANSFQLLFAELIQLWWGPSPPPLWTSGSGLEAHARDQLSFSIGCPKPTLLSRIAEMEACDFAWLVEERVIRSNARNHEAARFKQVVDQLPYFKKLRNTGTSLGDLQACVAITKLRPGGLMLWAREEPLSSTDGLEALNFLLDRSKLLCEWNFSQMGHALPSRVPLFPKYMYLFSRETDVQVRHAHRPVRVTLQGQIRSHIEVPLLLEDAFQSYFKSAAPRGHWKLHLQKSPSTQKDWAELWPDPATYSVIDALEVLRDRSVPLASVGTVRSTPPGDSNANHSWSLSPNMSAVMKGLWIETSSDSATPAGTPTGSAPQSDHRRLRAHPLPQANQPVQGSGYLILLSDPSWCAPLRAYLESDCVRNWLDHHAERRGDKWLLSEAIIKFIPVPKTLLKALKHPGAGPENALTLISPEWEKILSETAFSPKYVKERLSEVALTGNLALEQEISASVAVRTAWAIDELKKGQGRLLSMVGNDGQIHWKKLLEVLPKSENVPLAQHSQVRVLGSLPLHTPIGRIEKIKAPQPAVLLITESGFNMRIIPESPILLDMIFAQLKDLSHPTWSELSQFVTLPRRLELAETAATDVLRSHGEQSAKLKELSDLLNACLNF